MRKSIVTGVLLIIAVGLFLHAVVPRRFELRTQEDFLKGKFNGVSVSTDGLLALAPEVEKIAAPSEEFYLCYLTAGDGISFLGTGHGGKIYQIDQSGAAELYFQTPEMDITSLALDGKGLLYAGTSPNGKIYKITGKGEGEEFFNPVERYIWDLQFMNNGRLWAAVGETGGIYEIDSQGQGRMIFKAEENHVLCLRTTSRGDIVAGSGGTGLVYRISQTGRASVLFETPYEEVRSLALDNEGTIYAAASGTPAKSDKNESVLSTPRTDAEVTVTVQARVADIPSPPTSSAKESGAVYRIDAEGMATRLWNSEEEMVYTLIWEEEAKKVLFGTGNKGRIYSVDNAKKVSLLLQQNSEQIYQLVSADSGLFVLANNPCFLGKLRTEQRFDGEYVSPVFDAKILSSWGRIAWDAEIDSGASLQFQTRTGNTDAPDSTWSAWSPPYQKAEEQILSPKARFLQVKARFKTQSGRISPILNRVLLFYLQNNVAPTISRLDFLEPNEVYLKAPGTEDVIRGVERNLPDESSESNPLRIVIPDKKVKRKGFRTVVWDAADENGDRLRYALSMKKEGEREWRVLQDGLEDELYTFDTQSFPDGTYFFKLTASDMPSNPVGMELKSDKTSRPLVIDNSLPVIKNFSAVRRGESLDVSFSAEDSYSFIEEIKFLMRPGEWRVVFPEDGIADSRTESFKFSVKIPSGTDGLFTVRVRDSFGNIGVFRGGF